MIKIAVYGICKNEEMNAKSWFENVKAADYVVVGDTGSSDSTVEILQKQGAKVVDIHVTPWRFDDARNELLKHIPEWVDICISLDFDERLNENWREAINAVWTESATKLTYQYVERFVENYSVENSIITSRIHRLRGYKWVYPVHETLKYTLGKGEQVVFCPGLKICHTPDRTKDRSGYLTLMERLVEENPENLMFSFSLGQLYFRNGQFDTCIHMMEKILQQPHAAKDLIVACERYLCRAYAEKGQYNFSKKKLLQLIDQYPQCSSSYAELCTIAYKKGDMETIIELENKFSAIDFHHKSVYNEFANVPSLLYDISSFAYFHKQNYPKALKLAQKALNLDPQNERLKKNIERIKEFV